MVNALTPVYDFFAKHFLPEDRFKPERVARAGIAAGQRVLDVGAGTGTLAMMIQRAQPGARVTGPDGDPAILAIARAKTARAGMNVALGAGDARALPYVDSYPSCVASSVSMGIWRASCPTCSGRQASKQSKTLPSLPLSSAALRSCAAGNRISRDCL